LGQANLHSCVASCKLSTCRLQIVALNMTIFRKISIFLLISSKNPQIDDRTYTIKNMQAFHYYLEQLINYVALIITTNSNKNMTFIMQKFCIVDFCKLCLIENLPCTADLKTAS